MLIENPNTPCGKCGKEIGDWQDDCGFFYKMVDNPVNNSNYGDQFDEGFKKKKNISGSYVAVCETCCGPLTGDR